MAASRIVRKPLMGADFPPDRLPRAAIPASSTSRDQRLPSPVCGERWTEFYHPGRPGIHPV